MVGQSGPGSHGGEEGDRSIQPGQQALNRGKGIKHTGLVSFQHLFGLETLDRAENDFPRTKGESVNGLGQGVEVGVRFRGTGGNPFTRIGFIFGDASRKSVYLMACTDR